MTADRDPVVGGVLDLLPDPPPGERFWADLSARLRTERPNPALRPVPPIPADEADALRPLVRRPPTRRERRRRLVVGVAAAVVAAVAVLAVGALQSGRDDLDVVPPADSSTSVSSPDRPPVTNAVNWLDGFREQALAWVGAVSAGDADGAWALVGPQTREMLGSRAAFDQLMASAYREGWGAWDQPGVTVTAVPVAPEAPRIAAVVFQGTIPKEGPAAFHTAVLVVTDGEDGLVVEPSTSTESLGLIELPAGSEGAPSVRPGEQLGISIDHDAAAYAVAVDGVAVPEASLVRDDLGTIRGVLVGELAPGPHSLVVVMAVSPGGAIAAAAEVFTVAP